MWIFNKSEPVFLLKITKFDKGPPFVFWQNWKSCLKMFPTCPGRNVLIMRAKYAQRLILWRLGTAFRRNYDFLRFFFVFSPKNAQKMAFFGQFWPILVKIVIFEIWNSTVGGSDVANAPQNSTQGPNNVFKAKHWGCTWQLTTYLVIWAIFLTSRAENLPLRGFCHTLKSLRSLWNGSHVDNENISDSGIESKNEEPETKEQKMTFVDTL